MNKQKPKFGRKQLCPCSRAKKSFCPSLDTHGRPDGGGKCWSSACKQKFFPPPKPTSDVKNNLTSGQTRREHVYQTKDGDPHMRVTVTKRLSGDKMVFVEHWNGFAWAKGAGIGERMPYRLPYIIERIALGGTIVICEGEKDCDNAAEHGITATCNPFGAGKWQDQMSRYFEGARVTIVPDNDEVGRDHARRVEASLLAHGVEAVGTLDLRKLMPGLPEKGDLTDYIELGGDIGALRDAIEASCSEVDDDHEQTIQLPRIDWESLPQPLSQITRSVDNELHRTALLTALITTVGAIMPSVTTPYHGRLYSPALYFFLCGPPGSGKSCIEPALHLVKEIDREIRQDSKKKLDEYQRKQAASRSKGDGNEIPPVKPERKLLIVPADSTAPVLVRAICNNDSVLVFDTEADSLQNALRTETGDASSALRKAWHGERVDQARVSDDLHVSTDRPCLSMVLSGTPDQILVLIKHVASGLTSRFRFIMLPRQRTFANPFESESHEVHSKAQAHQMSIRKLWAYQRSDHQRKGYSVELNEAQKKRLVNHLQPVYEDVIEDADAGTTLRSGVVTVRIATVLTALRHWFGNSRLEREMMVADADFQTALVLGEFLRQQTEYVVQSLNQQSSKPVLRPFSNNKRKWLDALPQAFTTNEAIEIGGQCGIGRSSVCDMLKDEHRFTKIRHGRYLRKEQAHIRGP